MNFDNVQIELSNYEIAASTGQVHRGILFDIVLDADDLDKALNLAETYLDGIASVLAYADSIAVAQVETLIAYEYGPAQGDRAGIQSITMPLSALPVRMFRRDKFKEVMTAMLNSSERPRIERSLAWFRKGLANRYTLDTVQAHWTALESINPILEHKHGLQQERVIRACPKCGAPVIVFPTNNGVKRTIIGIGGEKLWRELNAVRQDLVHSRETISKFLPAAQTALTPLAQSVFDAVEDALELTNVAELRRTPMVLPERARSRVSFVLANASVADIPFGPTYPHIEAQLVDGVGEVSGTRVTESGSVRFVMIGYPREWRVTKLESTIVGDPDRPPPTVEFTDLHTIPSDALDMQSSGPTASTHAGPQERSSR